MKIALVCDDLLYHGGHENVVLDLCKIFPDAFLYTTCISNDWKKICNQNNIKVVTSFLQKFPFIEKLNRYYAPFLLHILAIESFDFDEYDLVISISSRFAHGVITKPKTLHVCYMSTVGRMFWETNNYFKYEKSGVFKLFKNISRLVLALPLSYLRLWDRAASSRVDFFVANSITTQKRIKKYYGRDAQIIHPFIDFKKISSIANKYENNKNKDYYVVLTRLVSWKRVDLAISACRNLDQKLVVIGTGPDKDRLLKVANKDKNIKFCGYVDFEQKIRYLYNAKAFINTQKEDFGITTLEAMSCGTPVIAYREGGAMETVIEGKTGDFFDLQEISSLEKVLGSFNSNKYKNIDCINRAKEFDIDYFEIKIKNFIKICSDAYQK